MGCTAALHNVRTIKQSNKNTSWRLNHHPGPPCDITEQERAFIPTLGDVVVYYAEGHRAALRTADDDDDDDGRDTTRVAAAVPSDDACGGAAARDVS